MNWDEYEEHFKKTPLVVLALAGTIAMGVAGLLLYAINLW